MDPLISLFFTPILLIFAVVINGVEGYAVVSGTVFCDQCKDGQRSLFDYPINGIKVMVACADSNGQMTFSREETTNLFGSFTMRFDGTPDLSGCYAAVAGNGQETAMSCGEAAGPAQSLRLMFRMFNMEMYVVDSLLSQPAQPMPFCSTFVPAPTTPIITPTPPAPPLSPPPPPPALPPPFRLPPIPQLPPLPPLPPLPFLEASACQHENWTNPDYRCYWRAVNPDTKVAVIFGMVAASRYGTDITLWNGLQGRGDLYRTLLREAITAFLNSYNSLQFPYPTISVLQHMNLALLGSPQAALLTALRFKRANSGYDHVPCKFNPCQ